HLLRIVSAEAAKEERATEARGCSLCNAPSSCHKVMSGRDQEPCCASSCSLLSCSVFRGCPPHGRGCWSGPGNGSSRRAGCCRCRGGWGGPIACARNGAS